MQKTMMFCDGCEREIVESDDYYKCFLNEDQYLNIVHFKNRPSFESNCRDEGKDFCGENCLIKFISENLSKL